MSELLTLLGVLLVCWLFAVVGLLLYVLFVIVLAALEQVW